MTGDSTVLLLACRGGSIWLAGIIEGMRYHLRTLMILVALGPPIPPNERHGICS
jgi:hypothetical protein